jgi:hypothetical protein
VPRLAEERQASDARRREITVIYPSPPFSNVDATCAAKHQCPPTGEENQGGPRTRLSLLGIGARRIISGVNGNPTSGVISEAWELYRRHWQHLIPIAAVIYVGLGVITLIVTALAPLVGALVGAIVSMVGVFWVQGALTRAVQDIRDGRADLSVGDTFTSVGNRIGPIAVASIVAGIALFFGFILFIIPGLYLLTIWSLIVPVIVLESTGAFESFGRSRDLVRGNGWNVFGVIVLTFLILLAFGLVIGLILSPLNASIRGFVSNIASGALTAPFVALTWTLVYYRLSNRAGSQPTPAA